MYHVEIVFDMPLKVQQCETSYNVNKLMCFCTCKRGVTQYWCSHRIAVFLWLKFLQTEFASPASDAVLRDSNINNFHQYAVAINLPNSTLDIVLLPMGVEQLLKQSELLGKLLEAQNSHKEQYVIKHLLYKVAQSDTRIKDALDIYLSDTDHEGKIVSKVAGKFASLHANQKINLCEYKMLGLFVMLCDKYIGEGANKTDDGKDTGTTKQRNKRTIECIGNAQESLDQHTSTSCSHVKIVKK